MFIYICIQVLKKKTSIRGPEVPRDSGFGWRFSFTWYSRNNWSQFNGNYCN